MAVTAAREGQFFIIGALLIAAVIVGIVLLESSGLQPPATQTPRQLFDRALHEFPTATNTITAEEDTVGGMERRMTSYLAFQHYLFASHGLQARSHTVIGLPQDTDITFLLFNHRRVRMNNVSLRVNGTEQTLGTLPSGETAQFSFTGVPVALDVRLSFTADRAFNQSYSTSRFRRSALYTLHLVGTQQTWQDTRVY